MTRRNDETIVCARCGQYFVWSYRKQRDFREHDQQPPKYCLHCRVIVKEERRSSRPGRRAFSSTPLPPFPTPIEPTNEPAPSPTEPVLEKRPAQSIGSLSKIEIVLIMLIICFVIALMLILLFVPGAVQLLGFG